jgi:putative transposase
VVRYVERNPVRANLVRRAEKWQWSSAHYWLDKAERPSFPLPGPARRPENWLEWVNQAATASELAALRRSVNRGTPFGGDAWMKRTADQLGLQSTLRPRGRPRKKM